MSSNKILKLIKEKEIEYIDLRFTDTKGKLQHVTMDKSIVDEDMLNEGIFFDQFDAQFNGNNNIFTIKKSRAYGFSLGLTGKGLVNSTNKTVNINGSIVPAYKLNTLFNNIPIIGEIFSGKEDEGIFAINYLAKGKWDDPDIEVNPLSALTPGIIRNIFDY